MNASLELNETAARLKDITERLLTKTSTREEAAPVCEELLAFFESLSPVKADYENPRYKDLAQMPFGKGLSPECAAGCIRDPLRTTRYLLAMRDAIEICLKKFGGPVRVLYAGTGPYAALLMPLFSLYGADQMKAILADCYEDSGRSVLEVIKACGFGDRVIRLHLGDAGELEPEEPPHIIVMEVLQHGLEKEPQVELTRRLAPKLIEGGILIPESVKISAFVGDMHEQYPYGKPNPAPRELKNRVPLGDVFTLTKDFPANVEFESIAEGAERFAAATLTVPELNIQHYELMLHTEIQLLGDIKLTEGDSGLTVPYVVKRPGRFKAGDVIQLDYVMDNWPQFEGRVTRG